uniref:Uncharacterized protein n=1 Tax=Helianthus annuus TaxID=4232 RepID=A0A251V9N1_HELAN
MSWSFAPTFVLLSVWSCLCRGSHFVVQGFECNRKRCCYKRKRCCYKRLKDQGALWNI